MLLTGFFLTGCMVDLNIGLEGSEPITEIRDMASFSSVRIGPSMRVSILSGSRSTVSVTTEAGQIENLSTYCHNGQLDLDWTQNGYYNPVAEIVITSPYLTRITHQGDEDIDVDVGARFDDLSLELNGSGDMTFHGDLRRLTATVNGSGTMELFGQTRDLRAEVYGSGRLYADPMPAYEVDAVMAGSGEITLALENAASLDLTLSGSGQVEWWGNPGLLRYRLLGSGKVFENRVLLKKGAGAPRRPASL